MSDNPTYSAPGTILILDTDTMISDLLKYNLENEGYTINLCDDADQALELDLTKYSLIIAEAGPIGPLLTGLRFCRMIKDNPDLAGIPVMFCTELDSEDDIISGFSAGADDYILRPFSLREMIARVKAIIRRHNMVNRAAAKTQEKKPENTTVIRFEGLVVDLPSQSVEIDGTRVQLSRTEFQILSILIKNPGRLFPRAEIFEIIRPGQDGGSDRTIDVNVSRIRKKLGDYANLIVNKSGQGYGFSTER